MKDIKEQGLVKSLTGFYDLYTHGQKVLSKDDNVKKKLEEESPNYKEMMEFYRTKKAKDILLNNNNT